MGRSTLDREWTDAEKELAERICDAVASAGPDGVVAALSIVRGVGMNFRNKKNESLRKIYDVMPLAVMTAPFRYPGHVLLTHPRYATYTMSKDEQAAKLVIVTRLKKVNTSLQRSLAEAEILRGRDDLGSIMAIKMLELTHSGLDQTVWNAIIAESDRTA